MRLRAAALILSCGIVSSIRRHRPGAWPPHGVITMDGRSTHAGALPLLSSLPPPAPGWGSSDRAGVAADVMIRTGRGAIPDHGSLVMTMLAVNPVFTGRAPSS